MVLESTEAAVCFLRPRTPQKLSGTPTDNMKLTLVEQPAYLVSKITFLMFFKNELSIKERPCG
jgi:hypothetical protein